MKSEITTLLSRAVALAKCGEVSEEELTDELILRYREQLGMPPHPTHQATAADILNSPLRLNDVERTFVSCMLKWAEPGEKQLAWLSALDRRANESYQSGDHTGGGYDDENF